MKELRIIPGNYLYREGEINVRWDMSEGFCVRGDTAAFLEEALAKLGLTAPERTGFTVVERGGTEIK